MLNNHGIASQTISKNQFLQPKNIINQPQKEEYYHETVSMLGNEYEMKICARCDYPHNCCACGSDYFESKNMLTPASKMNDPFGILRKANSNDYDFFKVMSWYHINNTDEGIANEIKLREVQIALEKENDGQKKDIKSRIAHHKKVIEALKKGKMQIR